MACELASQIAGQDSELSMGDMIATSRPCSIGLAIRRHPTDRLCFSMDAPIRFQAADADQLSLLETFRGKVDLGSPATD